MRFVVVALLSTFTSFAHAQEANVEAGKNAFTACVGCHSVDGVSKPTGPSLKGVVGRQAGTQEDFKTYSKGMKDSGVTWDDASLDSFLAAPAKFVKGTMMFMNVGNEKTRKDLIAYLKTLN